MSASGPWPRPTPGIPDDDAVGGVDEVRDGLQRVARPSVAKLLPFAQDRLPTHRRAGLRPALEVVHPHRGRRGRGGRSYRRRSTRHTHGVLPRRSPGTSPTPRAPRLRGLLPYRVGASRAGSSDRRMVQHLPAARFDRSATSVSARCLERERAMGREARWSRLVPKRPRRPRRMTGEGGTILAGRALVLLEPVSQEANFVTHTA